MRLHEVKIDNFRKLKGCTIGFRDSTFLIGANNAGKSSVFSAIQLLHSAKNALREDYSKTYNEDDDLYDYFLEFGELQQRFALKIGPYSKVSILDY